MTAGVKKPAWIRLPHRLNRPGRQKLKGPRCLRSGGFCLSLYRSRKQPVGCAPPGRTACDGRSALPQHVPCFGGVHHYGSSGSENGVFYSAHASSLSAALRRGALRAAASRPCLSTSCFGGIHHYGIRGRRTARRRRISCSTRMMNNHPSYLCDKRPLGPTGPRAGQARPCGAQPKAACVSDIT